MQQVGVGGGVVGRAWVGQVGGDGLGQGWVGQSGGWWAEAGTQPEPQICIFVPCATVATVGTLVGRYHVRNC